MNYLLFKINFVLDGLDLLQQTPEFALGVEASSFISTANAFLPNEDPWNLDQKKDIKNLVRYSVF